MPWSIACRATGTGSQNRLNVQSGTSPSLRSSWSHASGVGPTHHVEVVEFPATARHGAERADDLDLQAGLLAHLPHHGDGGVLTVVDTAARHLQPCSLGAGGGPVGEDEDVAVANDVGDGARSVIGGVAGSRAATRVSTTCSVVVSGSRETVRRSSRSPSRA